MILAIAIVNQFTKIDLMKSKKFRSSLRIIVVFLTESEGFLHISLNIRGNRRCPWLMVIVYRKETQCKKWILQLLHRIYIYAKFCCQLISLLDKVLHTCVTRNWKKILSIEFMMRNIRNFFNLSKSLAAVSFSGIYSKSMINIILVILPMIPSI